VKCDAVSPVFTIVNMRYLDKNNFVNSATPDPYGSREVFLSLLCGVLVKNFHPTLSILFVKYSQNPSVCS